MKSEILCLHYLLDKGVNQTISISIGVDVASATSNAIDLMH